MRGRILVFSTREYGSLGTAGTYNMVEQIRDDFFLRVVAKQPESGAVFRDRSIPFFPWLGPGGKAIKILKPMIQAFKPDVSYVFASPVWHEAVMALKEVVPNTSVVVDFQSPLLLPNSSRRQEIQQAGDQALRFVDRTLSLSQQIAQSWFSKISVNPYVYPLGVDIENIKIKTNTSPSAGPRQWVLSSVLHRAREIDELLRGFSHFLEANPRAAVLSVFGDGPDRSDLEAMTLELGIGDSVRFFGQIAQKELFERLASFDAGIAWVPYNLYDAAPSLKSLEYSAAGLPFLATATSAHLEMLDKGFSFEHCESNAKSVAAGMERLLMDSTTHQTSTNREAARKQSFRNVWQEHLLPIFQAQIEERPPLSKPANANRKEKLTEPGGLVASRNPKTMRLMFVVESLAAGKGGMERVASELASEMSKRGHAVYLFYRDPQLKGPAYSAEGEVTLLPYSDWKELRTILPKMDIDTLIMFYTQENIFRYVNMAATAGVPFVAQECSNPDRIRFNNWKGGEISRARASWEREVATSAASRLRLVMPSFAGSFSAFQQSQIRAMPNGAPRIEGAANPGESKDGHWRILLINGRKANKNLLSAVRAFAEIAPLYPGWNLRVVDGPSWAGPYGRSVAKVLDEYSLWDRIEITNSTDKIFEEYLSAHIHLIASRSEGCPTVVLEAMAAGLPSIGFEDCPGTNELIRHERNGLLARADEPESGLAEALSQLMSDPLTRVKLGRQASKDATKFDSKRTYDLWETLLYEAAEYRENPTRLFEEQHEVDSERALHVRRMRQEI